jgi:hypothetical protein
VTVREILTLYGAGENAFDLTVEKWVKIRESLEHASTLSHYREILGAVMGKVPLCLENQNNCPICPLHPICRRTEEGSFNEFMQAMQAYCIAGELLPRSPLLALADQDILELESCKRESLKKLT